MAAFEIKELKVTYGRSTTPALVDVTLSIESGSFTVVLGSNGSGKSTFLRCLGGFQPWQRGSILKDGISRAIDKPGFNSEQILISEDIVLPQFKLKELARIYKEIWPSFDVATFRRILKYSEISEDTAPGRLSRGQKILCQFALGLSSGVKTLLVDEVTAALDPYVRRKVILELVEKNRSGATVVIATNIVTEVQHLDVAMVILKEGKIFFSGRHSEIRNRFIKVQTREESSHLLRGKFVEVGGAMGVIYAVGYRDSIEGEIVKEAGVPSLEDVFVFLSHEGKT
ncbi:Vitamin B12 import ATP-binding protein BtuD [Bdellovibrio bacteriovorus]|uniref:ATP-binding cassette domain-containing protein n=1 Tax=Bdellovibrio bacteriovorus TaxID=959 RepID=UPI00045BF819|nr:ATP-binding cassette domain-containing protein [Bdellovibrio bacteriovorus]AHZ86483.1 hypothetical protein EP01_16295 [Bdellovibrio bacteriovorus]BEV67726.1 Vitamin B12 import ATP-binding protein BtuD [Bdellovibrio bacteriovorus]